jgi:hypothetical protein
MICVTGCARIITDKPPHHHIGAAVTWVLAQSSLSNILSADSSIATRVFDHPYVYITAAPGSSNPVPPGWRSVPTVNFKSYAGFSAAVSEGIMPSWTKAVLYDPEAWPKTPYDEQKNVEYYMRHFCRLAHRQGWQAIMMPGTDLMNIYPKRAGETNAQAFVRRDIAGGAARYADVSVVQSQSMETSPAAYNWFLTKTRSQALAANPHDVFLGGLTANLLGTTASSEVMYRAAISATNVVAGFSLNTSKNSPDPTNAAQFLHELAAYQQLGTGGVSPNPIVMSKTRETRPTMRPSRAFDLAADRLRGDGPGAGRAAISLGLGDEDLVPELTAVEPISR